MQLEDELDLMNKSFTMGLGPDDEVAPKPDDELPPDGDPSGELEDPIEDELPPDNGEPVGDIEDPVDPVKPVEPQEPSELDKAIARIAELEERTKPKESAPAPEPDPEPPMTFEEQDFLGDEDAYELTQDPKKFNALLNKIYQKAVTDTRKVLGEGVLRSIPEIVKTNLTAMTSLQKASDKFYEDNPDLATFKNVVATIFGEISSANPDKNYNDILKDVGTEARRRLELHKAAVPKPDPKAPRLPRPKGRSGDSKDKPKTDPLLNELEEMNKALGG